MPFRQEIIGDCRPGKGSRHYRWQGDAVSEKGGRKRALKLFPDAGPCTLCGSARAERHHRDDNTANNDPSNIAVLCRRCHMAEDGRLAAMPQIAHALLPKARAAAAAARRSKTHCRHGHEYSAENTRLNRKGARICRACDRAYGKQYLERRNAQV